MESKEATKEELSTESDLGDRVTVINDTTTSKQIPKLKNYKKPEIKPLGKISSLTLTSASGGVE